MKKFVFVLLVVFFSSISLAHIGHYNKFDKIEMEILRNDEVIGSLIADALAKVGKEGIISLEEGKGITTELEITEGMKLEKGFISPYFITNTDKMEVSYDNPYILMTNKKITLVQQELLPILEKIRKL